MIEVRQKRTSERGNRAHHRIPACRNPARPAFPGGRAHLQEEPDAEPAEAVRRSNGHAPRGVVQARAARVAHGAHRADRVARL